MSTKNPGKFLGCIYSIPTYRLWQCAWPSIVNYFDGYCVEFYFNDNNVLVYVQKQF